MAIALDDNDCLYRLSGNGLIDVIRFKGGSNWTLLDNNPATVAITVAGLSGQLYQLHDSGTIWQYTGRVCDPTCRETWQRLDNNPATARIVASSNELYQLHNNGSLWRYTGTPCNFDSCTGWELLIGDGLGRIAVDHNRVYALSQPVIRSARQRVCAECL